MTLISQKVNSELWKSRKIWEGDRKKTMDGYDEKFCVCEEFFLSK